MIKRNLPLIILLVLLAAWAIFLDKTADVFVFGFQRNEYSYHPAFKEEAFRTLDGSILTALYQCVDGRSAEGCRAVSLRVYDDG